MADPVASNVVNRCRSAPWIGGVGVEDDVPGGVVDQADRQRHEAFRSAGLSFPWRHHKGPRKGELLARPCELCGRGATDAVHQVAKLARLGKPGPRQAAWAALMARKRRKTPGGLPALPRGHIVAFHLKQEKRRNHDSLYRQPQPQAA